MAALDGLADRRRGDLIRNLDVPDFAFALRGEVGEQLRDWRATKRRLRQNVRPRKKMETQNFWQGLGPRAANSDDTGRPRALCGCGFGRRLDEGEQVRVHRIGMGGAHAVRETFVDLKSPILQELCRERRRVGNRHNLIIITVHDELSLIHI